MEYGTIHIKLDELLKAAQLDGKSTYVIPNGSTVIPRVKGANQ